MNIKKLIFIISLFTLSVASSAHIVDRSNHIYIYEEMCRNLQQFDSVWHEKVTLQEIAKTYDGRSIHQMVIGNPEAPHALYIHSTIHGREWMNTWCLMTILEDYLRKWNLHYAHGCTYGDVFNACCIHFIPMLNPDGVCISQFGPDSIRDDSLRVRLQQMPGIDTYKLWKSNARGVDLNRNFPYAWQKTDDGPSFGGYSGDTVASELETQCAISALHARNFDVALSYHSTGHVIYWDLKQKGDILTKTHNLASYVHTLIPAYRMGEASLPRGLDYNYMNLLLQIPTIEMETGKARCPLPYYEFSAICAEQSRVIVALANKYGK